MRTLACFVLLLVLPASAALAQAKTRRLPGIINHPSLNLYSPYISHDGNALLFISDNGEDGALALFYTSRENDWTEPVAVPKNVFHRLTFLRGFGLSADGKKIFYTSTKSPIVGGYDIVFSELKGTSWTEPLNLMLPVNTKTNEGCPSISADGNTLYFMRCDKMDQNKADGCKLFVTKKKPNGQWDEPKELPANINTGNSQAPRIMADDETLIFSSNKMASTKGGMDLYESRLVNGTWSDPVPLDFVNSDKDDQYVGVAALGRYLLKEAPGPRKNSEIVEFLFPNELRPKGMMKIEGKITDAANAPTAAYIDIMDVVSNKRVYSARPAADGSYMVYLREGTRYQFSVDPEQSNNSYFTKVFDLTSDKTPQKEKVNVVLKQPVAGDEFALDFVAFKPNSSTLDPTSQTELKKLVRMAKANPQVKFEIQVMLKGYQQDSLKSDPDLTEVTIDSVMRQVSDIDSLGKAYKKDTLVARTIYHNDRTQAQAKQIVDYLKLQGLDPASLTSFVNAIPVTPGEPKKLTIKVAVRPKQ
ncbi:PD40 domain-containing protein [Chryseolinea lacunae]|uniref:PD40 domain-containing protein n=1 Tax=Chryseolinea lacunae TaxID=2801331 RepID=A0ABS1KQT1_9BACT|nr:PD40 domain-containing protein [Chryseolinea lacunae]MBL0741695.1 PD40 domain-containing protein [Chryseolinea lacunae]